MEEEHETSSLRARRRKSSVSLGCCFNGGSHGHHRRADSLDAFSSSFLPPSPSRILFPSAWIRSKTHDLTPKGKYRNLMSFMGRHRRHSSAEFSYDPLSYSLNFEDIDDNSYEVEESHTRSFTARLAAGGGGGGGDQSLNNNSDNNNNITKSSTSTTSRAAAVAEVRKSLQQPDEEEEEEEDLSPPGGRTRTRSAGTLELPTRRPIINNTRKQLQEVGEEIRKSRSSDNVAHGDQLTMRRSLDIPHPTSTLRKVSFTSTTTSTSPPTTSTALVASPTSRQVLVELC